MKFTIKKIITTIIPHGVIRFAKKRLNIRYLLFGPAKKDVGTYLVDDRQTSMKLYGMAPKIGEKVAAGFEECYHIYQSHPNFLRKYVLHIKDCFIEPMYGWAIDAADDKLIADSISNNSWIETYHPSYFAYKKNKDNAIALDAVVSINMLKGGEHNYWHFLHDLLGEVTIALDLFPEKIPFMISKELSEKAYFKQALALSPVLADIEWIIRDEKYFRVKDAYFIQVMPNGNEQFFNVQKLLGVPDADPQSNRKIFLTRSNKRIRFLKNREAIESIAVKYGFEIVDTDGYTLAEQIKLFSETKYLIGIHGAGLTNVMFRKYLPLTLFELLPADYLQPHYFWLCKGMNAANGYDCQVGSAAAIDTSFEISPTVFETKVQQMITL